MSKKKYPSGPAICFAMKRGGGAELAAVGMISENNRPKNIKVLAALNKKKDDKRKTFLVSIMYSGRKEKEEVL